MNLQDKYRALCSLPPDDRAGAVVRDQKAYKAAAGDDIVTHLSGPSCGAAATLIKGRPKDIQAAIAQHGLGSQPPGQGLMRTLRAAGLADEIELLDLAVQRDGLEEVMARCRETMRSAEVKIRENEQKALALLEAASSGLDIVPPTPDPTTPSDNADSKLTEPEAQQEAEALFVQDNKEIEAKAESRPKKKRGPPKKRSRK